MVMKDIPAENTLLAACFDGRDCWVMYQQKCGLIALYNCRTGNDWPVVDAKDAALPVTPLACTFITAEDDRPGMIYVYFSSRSLALHGVWSYAGEKLRFEQEGAPTKIPTAPGTIAEYS
ncbi:hypothetical protein EJ06DRAFT_558514 [Trichodelitschia bisporula]|uniref:Fucose-specific lectin n=1 Tax=Trichodelitschia bisporula TaxID=703511 RepID=A0A6G1HQB9_9PEZI|nr:hypothetical protein EJ06DRAFT_558514 [Trichodelitschia bisporula]